jgi:hypothetical protein
MSEKETKALFHCKNTKAIYFVDNFRKSIRERKVFLNDLLIHVDKARFIRLWTVGFLTFATCWLTNSSWLFVTGVEKVSNSVCYNRSPIWVNNTIETNGSSKLWMLFFTMILMLKTAENKTIWMVRGSPYHRWNFINNFLLLNSDFVHDRS